MKVPTISRIIRAALCVVLCAAISELRADTDWVVLPIATDSGRMLLHALRDNSKPIMTDLRFEKGGAVKSLRIGNNKSKFTHAGLNAAGVAIVVTGTPAIVSYLPILLLSGIAAGLFTGFAAQYFVNRMDREH